MSHRDELTIGVDFGTSGVRAVVLDTVTGEELSTDIAGFPEFEKGAYCDASAGRYRQHPAELIDAFTAAVTSAVSALPADKRAGVRAITVDTTGSSPTAVDTRGRPLALDPQFADNPDAMVVLWKDRSSIAEADAITRAAQAWGSVDFLRFSGGAYSAEWFWAKILHAVRSSPDVGAAAAGWLEHSDWMPALLCDAHSLSDIPRNRCGAAHKAMWNSAFGGYPPAEFFDTIDPYLANLRTSLPSDTLTADNVVGRLSETWAETLGLPPTVQVGVGVFDAHAGAIGAGVRAGVVVKVIGTSSAEMIVTPADRLRSDAVPGIESQATGSMIPNLIGIEAGQPAFGDIFRWFADLVLDCTRLAGTGAGADGNRDDAAGGDHAGGTGGSGDSGISATAVIEGLSQEAARREPSPDDPVALDWFNGRRAPFAANDVSSALSGLTLGTTAPQLFSALVRAAAFGTRRIHEHLRQQGVPIDVIRTVGGIPKKSPYVVQTLADVLQAPVEVVESPHASARGAALLAKAAIDSADDCENLVARLSGATERRYVPDPGRKPAYDRQYEKFLSLSAWSDPRSVGR